MSNLLFKVAEAEQRNATNVGLLDQVAPQSLFGGQAGQSLATVLNQIFYVGLVAAVALALFMVVRGGVQYMTTDSIDGKGGAKARIQAALGGLVLAFSAILILSTINPSLVTLSLKFDPVQLAKQSNAGISDSPTSGVTSGTRPDGTNGTTPTNPGNTNAVVKGDFSNVTAADLRPFLGSGYSDADVQAFIEAGKAYGIDPRFLASISKFETANGTSKAFTDGRNNAMGTSNTSGPIGFNSVRDSIFTQAHNLVKEGGHYDGLNTIQQIGDKYSPAINPATGKPYQNDLNGTNWSWAQSVSANYNQMTGGR